MTMHTPVAPALRPKLAADAEVPRATHACPVRGRWSRWLVVLVPGYVRQGTWWRVGALVSLLNVVIRLDVGMLW